ncbi:ogr/Delta-like zinc finger family protein [Pseudomonas sp. GM60]|uniref:ogr/Delta-like zinc finger family protein n=1 Tax=Pseudomonas sp. GM60 TaxID=1144334 RepID=UPI0009DA1AC2|nr:ogr/Delta-like zinc finger family protein [Pseudomonas sp. GM60]
MRINCRECKGKALISEVEDVSLELKRLYCLCLNPRCAYSFVMSFSFSHSLKPSAKEENGFLLDRLRELPSHKKLQILEQLDMLT